MAAPHGLPTAASTLVRPQGIGIAMLMLAGVADLPLVYLLIRADAPPYTVLLAGLLSMGLAWAGGFFLEGKRLHLARLIVFIGIVQGAAAFHPLLVAVEGRFFVLASMVLSLAGLLLVRGRAPTPKAMRAERS